MEPIVQRDEILSMLRHRFPETMRLNEIAKALELASDSEEYQVLRQTLNTLVDDGAVYRSSRRRYGLTGHSQTSFDGILTMHGFNGVVQTSSPHFPKVHVKRPHLWTALHGDDVRVKLMAFDKDDKPNGEIISVNKRNCTTVVGKLEFNGDFYFLIPDDEHVHVDFLIHPKRLKGAKDGDKVVVHLKRWEDPFKSPEAEVVEILGRAGMPKVEFASIAREFRLRREFTADIESEAEVVARKVSTAEIRRRRDLRADEIITIDPDDARDFDDALSLQILDNGNYYLGVHIADVSHYVKEGSELDREALSRGNSVYLVDGVIPMLPEKLSNSICSLMPARTRLAFSVFMELSPRGALKSHEITESVIKSKKRFTYNDVQQLLDGKGKSKHLELLQGLHKLAQILRRKRYTKGGIDFTTTEVKFILNEEKQPVRAMLKGRSDATSLVEECMLMANQTVANHLHEISPGRGSKKRPLPFLYRIHENPDQQKLQDALELMRAHGMQIPARTISSKDINRALNEAAGKPEFHVINMVLLRAMAKAVYADFNVGHYGLGFANYTHFTSPIRRYPDLVIHRLLKEYTSALPDRKRLASLYELMDEISDHCSARETLAVEAERASAKLTQVAIARERIGQAFGGVITGVTNFGMFVMIDDIYAEGLLRVRDLDDDYYFFDEKKFSLVGKRRRKVFRIGTRLRVQIARVNVEKREIDFVYLGSEQSETAGNGTASGIDEALELLDNIERKKRKGRGRQNAAQGKDERKERRSSSAKSQRRKQGRSGRKGKRRR